MHGHITFDHVRCDGRKNKKRWKRSTSIEFKFHTTLAWRKKVCKCQGGYTTNLEEANEYICTNSNLVHELISTAHTQRPLVDWIILGSYIRGCEEEWYSPDSRIDYHGAGFVVWIVQHYRYIVIDACGISSRLGHQLGIMWLSPSRVLVFISFQVIKYFSMRRIWIYRSKQRRPVDVVSHRLYNSPPVVPLLAVPIKVGRRWRACLQTPSEGNVIYRLAFERESRRCT